MMKLSSNPTSSGPGLISPFQSIAPPPSPRCHLPTTPVRYPAPFSTLGERRPARLDDQPGVARQDARPLLPPGILAGQQRIPRRRAGRRRRVGVGEVQPLPRQPVDVRRQPRSRAVAAHVAEAEVVGVDEHDVRRCGRGFVSREREEAQDQGGGSSTTHEMRLRWEKPFNTTDSGGSPLRRRHQGGDQKCTA